MTADSHRHVVELIGLDFGGRCDFFHDRQCRVWRLCIRHRESKIDLHNECGLDGKQQFVQRHYFHLICLIPREAFCMNGTDRSLNLVGPNALFWQRLFQYRDTLLNYLAVPTFAALIL